MKFFIKWSKVSFLVFNLVAATAHAATYTVDRTDDSSAITTCSSAANDCTLRGAIIKANLDAAEDTIVVPAGTYTLSIRQDFGGANEGDNSAANTATVGDLDVTEDLIITGDGADDTVIDASGITDDDRAIQVHSTVDNFTISGVTIMGGDTGFRGGGLWAFSVDNVSVSNCSFENNNADADGGGMATDGSTAILISNSSFSGNTADQRGGGIFHETGVETIINSTFSGNSTTAASSGGGAIDVTTGSLVLISSTLVNNTVSNAAGSGGGIRHVSGAGSVTIKNSILVGNAVNGTDDNCGGTQDVISEGYNFSDDATCAFAGTGDQNSVATSIINTTLADNGGQTPTHALVASSVAIDAVPLASCLDANDSSLTTDQRGFTRPNDSAGTSLTCDSGAVEVGCGNGTVELSETCDGDGETATCDLNCTAVACGDGTENATAGETCDDGNTTNGDGCSSACLDESSTTNSNCGNGTVDSGEACDASGESSTCDTDCTAVSCGDSTTNSTAGETCDDGNNSAGDGCADSCVLENETDLEADNPSVDFSELAVGSSVTLTAPEPTTSSSVSAELLATLDGCDCSWSVNPTDRATFGQASACSTQLTPQAAGTGQITVSVDCGTTNGTFLQTVVVNAASSGSSGGSSGCSLTTQSEKPQSLLLGSGFCFVTLLLMMRKRLKLS